MRNMEYMTMDLSKQKLNPKQKLIRKGTKEHLKKLALGLHAEKRPLKSGELVKNISTKLEETKKFIVQEHDAVHAGHHFDFRIRDAKNKWRSFAIPKGGFPRNLGMKRFAASTPDHTDYWATFKGKIPDDVKPEEIGLPKHPKGKVYGRGVQSVYDKGKIKIIKDENKTLTFNMKGKKVKGLYTMIKTKEGNWLLFKRDNPAIIEGERGLPNPTRKQLLDLQKRLKDLGINYKYGYTKGQRQKTIVVEEGIRRPPNSYSVRTDDPHTGEIVDTWTWQQQTRSADEPPTTFYRNKKTGKTWREY